MGLESLTLLFHIWCKGCPCDYAINSHLTKSYFDIEGAESERGDREIAKVGPLSHNNRPCRAE